MTEPTAFKALDVDYSEVQWPDNPPAPDKHIHPMAPGLTDFPGDGAHG